ncbi:hypothetical protein KGF42_18420 [Clostridioides sp. ZZV15-6383]|uniref:hypothetical protein n=1 Tax=Clostridioides sp. ZZV15-6383 TaxID=2811498 RepID=UPI001D10D775|nr:hypothetical protein [Clostridioides sp. ZZV15-6383]
MKLKRKIFAIFLSCFLVISSTINSFALAPALVAVAPEVVNVVATLAVASGVALTTKDDIYDVVRLVYENTPNWDSFVDTFKKDVSISADNVVKVGNDFLDMCKFAFDNIFSSVPPSYNSISAVGSLIQGSTIDLKNYSSPFEFSFTNFKVVCEGSGSSVTIDIQIPYSDGTGFFKCASYYTNSTLLDKYRINSIKVQDYKTILDITFYMLPSKWNPSGDSYRDTYIAEKPLSGVAYDLPYVPGSYDWDKVAGKVIPGEDGLDVYVPNNSSDLIGVPGEDVFVVENNPPYDLPADGTVTVPNVENPSLPVGDNIVIPGDSVVDPPIDPPVDPPIDPPVDIPVVDINFKPLVDAMSNFKEKFPFSLPFDFARIFEVFNVEPKSPNFELPFYNFSFDIDFSLVDLWIRMFRYFFYICFLLGLIFITNKLKP